ncbi:hypothetical protein BASA61_006277 [Batrachochytrium salamandrivorans]|nr:hypothetical protein BASA60_010160 [Batrachochytrium salamandrivorans]KAH6577583.1 hypothetical protein BASA62_000783 [Batrachochytrium salamandrivorans]KAH6587551.1 hypothetical protein BASA61_006277 [Batrachochytrium salamandrivorans]KAH9267999.1 hypothetical protein BASA84_000465 [Batrachochytrium salamandrivorans]KAH9276922.1 hypothetical protein BASA83_000434 [Batrachochytrium salamandrivorans]
MESVYTGSDTYTWFEKRDMHLHNVCGISMISGISGIPHATPHPVLAARYSRKKSLESNIPCLEPVTPASQLTQIALGTVEQALSVHFPTPT